LHFPYDRGKPRKTSARRRASTPVIASNGVPYLNMRTAGLHRRSGREKEGNNAKAIFKDRSLNQSLLAACKL